MATRTWSQGSTSLKKPYSSPEEISKFQSTQGQAWMASGLIADNNGRGIAWWETLTKVQPYCNRWTSRVLDEPRKNKLQ